MQRKRMTWQQRKLLRQEEIKKELLELVRIRRADAIRVKELKKSLAPKKEEKSTPEWSDKVNKIRNRLTGKQRVSKDRWNRFAGTSDGGGRGL